MSCFPHNRLGPAQDCLTVARRFNRDSTLGSHDVELAPPRRGCLRPGRWPLLIRPQDENPMVATFGYGASSPTAPLGPFRFERREPGPRDVAIEILYCGVCHSDLHLA